MCSVLCFVLLFLQVICTQLILFFISSPIYQAAFTIKIESSLLLMDCMSFVEDENKTLNRHQHLVRLQRIIFFIKLFFGA